MSGAEAWPLIRSPAEQLPGGGVGGGGVLAGVRCSMDSAK